MKEPSSDNQKLKERKLQLEIKELEKSWIYRLDFYRVALPTILAIASIIYGFASGFLDTKSERLRTERALLEIEVSHFQKKRDSLVSENLNLIDSINYYKNQLKVYQVNLDSLVNQTNTFTKKINSQEKLLNSLDLKINTANRDLLKTRNILRLEVNFYYLEPMLIRLQQQYPNFKSMNQDNWLDAGSTFYDDVDSVLDDYLEISNSLKPFIVNDYIKSQLAKIDKFIEALIDSIQSRKTNEYLLDLKKYPFNSITEVQAMFRSQIGMNKTYD